MKDSCFGIGDTHWTLTVGRAVLVAIAFFAWCHNLYVQLMTTSSVIRDYVWVQVPMVIEIDGHAHENFGDSYKNGLVSYIRIAWACQLQLNTNMLFLLLFIIPFIKLSHKLYISLSLFLRAGWQYAYGLECLVGCSHVMYLWFDFPSLECKCLCERIAFLGCVSRVARVV